MVITDYRVQSVLRTYTKQLQRSKLAERIMPETSEAKPTEEKVSISGEARRMMMERLSSQVMEKAYPTGVK
jgi:hypothetical protein